MEPEVDFPRGGAGTLTALEIRDVRHQAKQDVLFNEAQHEPATPKRATKKQAKDKTPSSQKVATPSFKRTTLHEFPSMKKLTVGALLLCAVREVKDYSLQVSLPFNIAATVHITDISEPITSLAHRESIKKGEKEEEDVSQLPSLDRLCHAGMLLPCSVTSIQGKHVSVSVDPAIVNASITTSSVKQGLVITAWVTSVEDHGYIVSFGLSSKKTGFLLNKNAQQFIKTCNNGKPLRMGQVVSCLILPGANARSVPVTINPDQVQLALVGAADHLLTVNDIVPGMLVNATVKEVTPTGLVCTIFGIFEAHVSIRHLSHDSYSTESYLVKKKYKARVLWVDRSIASIGLTLLPDIVRGIPQIPNLEIGDIIEEATIVHVDGSNALMLDLQNGLRGYSPISMVSEERISKFGKQFAVGTCHPCRVIQLNLIDGVVVVSLQKSVLDRPFMTYKDIILGALVSGTVLRHEPYGMLVQLTDHIRGLCPTIHLADTKLKHPGKKLKVGKSVECKVLEVDATSKRLLLTHKNTLVESPFPALTDYMDATPGATFHGVVTAVKDFGCVVRFFNNVRGIVRKSELSSQFIPDPQSTFAVGQVVQCTVIECDPTAKRLSLSLKGDKADDATDGSILPGQVVEAAVTAVLPEGLSLELLPSRETAFLPVSHLSDHTELCPLLLDVHQEKLEYATIEKPYIISGLLFVCPKLPSRPVLVTRKNSLLKLVDSEENFSATSFTDLQPGMVLDGFIKKSLPYGCFVEFMNNLVALAPNKYLKDEYISDGSSVYSEGQSVRAKVLELDKEKQRFLVTLRCSDLQMSGRSPYSDWSKSLLDEFESYLKVQEEVLENLSVFEGKLSTFSPGSCMEGTVLEVKANEQSLLLDLGDGIAGSAYCGNVEEHHQGDIVACCVMEARQDGVVSVSVSPKLLEDLSKVKKKKRKSSAGSSGLSKQKLQLAELQPGNTVMVQVEVVTSHYIIGTCTLLSGHVIVYGLLDTGQLNVFPANMKFVKPGASIRATVCSPATWLAGEQAGPAVVMVTREKEKGGTIGSHDPLDVKQGDIMDVTIKNIRQLQMDIRAGMMRGRVHITQVLDSLPEDSEESPLSKYGSGDVMKARVITIRDRPNTSLVTKGATSLLELSIKPSVMASRGVKDFSHLLHPQLTIGSSQIGFIKMVAKTHLVVCLTPSLTGEIPMVLTSTDPEVLATPTMYYSVGQVVQCVLVKVDGKQPLLSMIGVPKKPSVDDVIVGQVRQVVPHECLLVSFAAGLLGRVDITDMSDEYGDHPLTRSLTHSIVKCSVISINEGHIDLSLRQSRLDSNSDDPVKDPEITAASDVKVGQVLRGFIKSKTNVGFFVRLGRKVTGRVKIGNLTDKYVEDFKSLYQVGELVTAKVISVQELEKKIELSLRHSDVNSKSKKSKKKQQRKRSNIDTQEDETATPSKKRKMEISPVEENDSEDDLEEEMVYSSSESPVSSEDEGDDEICIQPQRPRLAATVGFNWDTSDSINTTAPDSSEDDEAMEEENEVAAKKKSKRQKRADKKAEEKRLFNAEQTLLDVSRAPQGPEDFDRLLMGSPNDSMLWLQYMAFYLHTTEIDKARAISQRALQTISFREEKEKLNIWVALLNLENLYGSQEALLKVFDEALRQNEPIDVFFRLVTIYQKSGKFELAEQLFQTMTKRFKDTPHVWTQYGLFLMKQGRPDAARKVLEKSLKAVNMKQHVDVIVKFSQYEFQHGDVERGKTMLESVLRNYPKRVDVWSVYIDLLIKQEDLDHVRELFERAIHLKLSSKRMKFFFKRYLNFEEQYGNEATVLAVKEKAMAYVKSVT